MRIELTTVSLQGSPASLGTCEPVILSCGQGGIRTLLLQVHYDDLLTQIGFTDQCRYLPKVVYIFPVLSKNLGHLVVPLGLEPRLFCLVRVSIL